MKSNVSADLPVLEALPRVHEALDDAQPIVLTAPPGSGKSTALPQALLGTRPGRIFVTQPRRLAARLLARRVSSQIGERLGEQVGYAVRADRRAGDATRLLYVTEGLLLRRVIAGWRPDERDLVILDEFHERSIDADLLLGVLVERGVRIMVASATIDAESLAKRLSAKAISVDGRLHPVEVEYRRAPSASPPWELAVDAIRSANARLDPEGDILVFMPGRREIDETVRACRRAFPGLDVRPLHGGLSVGDQDAAIRVDGPRRIVVATNIAETSITIPRVTTVVDAGLARVPRYDVERDVARLSTEPVDRAGADQRAGRAGRVRPGRCLRLYTEADYHRRPAQLEPATSRSDLTDAFLRLRLAGVRPDDFQWIDPPPRAAQLKASSTLELIGAVEDDVVTPAGREAGRWPVSPRVGRFLGVAHAAGGGELATACAAVLETTDATFPTKVEGALRAGDPSSDLVARARVVLTGSRDRRGIADTVALFEDLRRRGGSKDGESVDAVVEGLLVAFPDRIAFRRSADRDSCVLPGRRNVVLERQSIVQEAGFLICPLVRGIEDRGEGTTIVGCATMIEESRALEYLADRWSIHSECRFDLEKSRVELVQIRRFDGDLVDESTEPVDATHRRAASEAMLAAIESGTIALPGWSDGVASFLDRMRRVGEWFPEKGLQLLDHDDLAVLRAEIVGDAHRVGDLPSAGRVLETIRNALDWNDLEFIERAAPDRIPLGSGRTAKVDWVVGEPPRIRARISDLIGVDATPTVAMGRVPVVLEILAPNRRPVQITDDLPGFWKRTYPSIRKELRRRYPKHPWP